MQETELRFDMLETLDDMDTALVNGDIDLARQDIQEFREYLKQSTKIEPSTSVQTEK